MPARRRRDALGLRGGAPGGVADNDGRTPDAVGGHRRQGSGQYEQAVLAPEHAKRALDHARPIARKAGVT